MANNEDNDELQPEQDTQNRSAVDLTAEQRKSVMHKVENLIQDLQNRSYTIDTLNSETLKKLVGKQLPASYAQVETSESKNALILAKNLVNAICRALKSCYVVAYPPSTTPNWVHDPKWARHAEALEAVLHHVAGGFHTLLEGFDRHDRPSPSIVENIKVCKVGLATHILPLCMEIASSEDHAKLSARTRREFLDIVYVAVEGVDGRRARKTFRGDQKNEACMAMLLGKTKDRHLLDAAFKLLCCVFYTADTPLTPSTAGEKATETQSTQKIDSKKKTKGAATASTSKPAKGKGKGAKTADQDTGPETQEARNERLGTLFFGRNPQMNTFTPDLSKRLVKEYTTADGKAIAKSTTKRVEFSNKMIDAIVESDMSKPQTLIVKSLEIPQHASKFSRSRLCVSSKEDQAAVKAGDTRKELEYALFINERSITTWLDTKLNPEDEEIETGIWELELDQVQSIDYESAGKDTTLVTFKSITPSDFYNVPLLGDEPSGNGLHTITVQVTANSIQKMKEALSMRYLPVLQDRSCLKPGSSISRPASRIAKVAANEQIKPPKSSQPQDIAGPDLTPPMEDGSDALKARADNLEAIIVNQPDTSGESIRAESMRASKRPSREVAAAQEQVEIAVVTTTATIEQKGDDKRVEKMAAVSVVKATSVIEDKGFDAFDSELSDLEEEKEKEQRAKNPAKDAPQLAADKKRSATTATVVETASKRKSSEESGQSKTDKRRKVTSEDSDGDDLPDLRSSKKDKEVAPVENRRKGRDSGFDEIPPPPLATRNDEEEDSGNGTDYDLPEEAGKQSKAGGKDTKKASTTGAAKKTGAARKLASSTPVKKKRGSRGGASESDSSKATAAAIREVKAAPKARTTRAAKAAATQAISDQASDNASQDGPTIEARTKARITSHVPPDSDPVDPQPLPVPPAVPSKAASKRIDKHRGDSSTSKKDYNTLSQLCDSNLPDVVDAKKDDNPEEEAQDRTQVWDEGVSISDATRKTSAKEGRKPIPEVYDEPRTDDAFEDLLADPPAIEEDPVRQYTNVYDDVSAASLQPGVESGYQGEMDVETTARQRTTSITSQMQGPAINILPPSLTSYKANVNQADKQPKVEDPEGVLSSPSEDGAFEDQMDDMHFFAPVQALVEQDYAPRVQDRRSPGPVVHVGAVQQHGVDKVDPDVPYSRRTTLLPSAKKEEKLQLAERQRTAAPIAAAAKKNDDTNTNDKSTRPFLSTEDRQKRAPTAPLEVPASKAPAQAARVKRVRASKMAAAPAPTPAPAPPTSPPLAADFLRAIAPSRDTDLRAPVRRTELQTNKDQTPEYVAHPAQQDKGEASHGKRIEHQHMQEYAYQERRASSVMEVCDDNEMEFMTVLQKLNQVLLSDMRKKKEVYSDSRDTGVEGIVAVVQAGLMQASKADGAYFSELKELNEECHSLQKAALEPLASLETGISDECKRITSDIACLGQIKALFAKRCPTGMFKAMPTCIAIRADQ